MTLSIFDAAREAPGELALVVSGLELSFGELARRVEQRIALLHGAGCLDERGERPLAVLATTSLDTVETLLALFAAGTPALLLHPRATTSEQRALVERARALGPLDSTPATAKTRARPSFDAERIAAIVPTSGTTGSPRLARLSHRALVSAALASRQHLGAPPGDRWLLTLPIAHVSGLSILTRSLVARRAVVLFERGEREAPLVERTAELARALGQQRVTLLSLVPALLARLLASADPRDLATLRAILVGGAPIPRALLERAADQRVPVLTSYGLTETSAQAVTRPYENRFDPPDRRTELAPAGVPLPGVAVRVQDGLIEVSGPTLFSGYAGEPEFRRGDWLRTHDRGTIDARGELVVTGRDSELIITGGENVDPAEVEAALLSLPDIEDVCVVGLHDPEYGEKVVALVVPRPARALDLARIREHAAVSLSTFKLPRALVVTNALPRLTTGKIDRIAAERLASGKLDERGGGE